MMALAAKLVTCEGSGGPSEAASLWSIPPLTDLSFVTDSVIA